MKVTKILETIKTGTGKKGKWTLVEIEVDDDKKARGFMPVTVGDEVDLEYNEQYKNYSFKVLGGSTIPEPPIRDTNTEALQIIMENTQTIIEQNEAILNKIDPPINE